MIRCGVVRRVIVEYSSYTIEHIGVKFGGGVLISPCCQDLPSGRPEKREINDDDLICAVSSSENLRVINFYTEIHDS